MDCEGDYWKRANLQSGKRNTRKEGGKAPFLNPHILFGYGQLHLLPLYSASKLILFKVLAYDLYVYFHSIFIPLFSCFKDFNLPGL